MATKKRANNHGSIFEDKARNKFRAQVTVPGGKTISKRFDTEPEARNWLNEQLVDISKGQYIEPSNLTLGEWLIEWLQLYSKDNVRQRTYERYLSLAKHCEPISKMKLQALRPSHFQRPISKHVPVCRRNAKKSS